MVRSSTRLNNAPEASAPGFQYTAEASSVTATKAPAIPAARVVTGSNPCAETTDGRSEEAPNSSPVRTMTGARLLIPPAYGTRRPRRVPPPTPKRPDRMDLPPRLG